jgi:hypothetical protein
MAVLDTSITFSRGEHTASLVVTADGTPITTYALAASGTVTISALAAPVVIPIANWTGFIDDVQEHFIALVHREVRPATTTLHQHLMRVEWDGSNKVKLHIEQQGGAFVLSQATYKTTTKEITFDARTGTSMTWLDFWRWYDFLRFVAADIALLT